MTNISINGKIITVLEKMYEDKYCKECYEIIQNKNAEAKRKLEEERIKEEKRIEKEKLDMARNNLLYTNYYWVVIGNISLIPFHYEDIFNRGLDRFNNHLNLTNKNHLSLEIVKGDLN